MFKFAAPTTHLPSTSWPLQVQKVMKTSSQASRAVHDSVWNSPIVSCHLDKNHFIGEDVRPCSISLSNQPPQKNTPSRTGCHFSPLLTCGSQMYTVYYVSILQSTICLYIILYIAIPRHSNVFEDTTAFGGKDKFTFKSRLRCFPNPCQWQVQCFTLQNAFLVNFLESGARFHHAFRAIAASFFFWSSIR